MLYRQLKYQSGTVTDDVTFQSDTFLKSYFNLNLVITGKFSVYKKFQNVCIHVLNDCTEAQIFTNCFFTYVFV